MIFYDTETCGFFGMPVIIQYARDDGDIHIHDIWEKPAEQTMDLIQLMMDEGVCGYNLTFDHFHLQKLYNTLELVDPDECPINMIHEMYEAEAEAPYGKCLKPYESVDLMMHVRKSKFQQSMGRPEWKISKVHLSLVPQLVEYLNTHTNLESYMHISQDAIWHSEVIVDEKKNWVHRDFRNVIGRIKPSGGLKSICAHILGIPVTKYPDVMPSVSPVEIGYIPIAKRIVEMDGWPTKTPPEALKKDYKGTWPLYIRYYVQHWKEKLHRKYANDDVMLTRSLYEYFDCPGETVDSALTAVVASCRWRGFDLDIPKLEIMRDSLISEIDNKVLSASKAKEYLLAVMDQFEKDKFFDPDGKIQGKTGKEALSIMSKWTEICDTCLENEWDGCPDCPPSAVAGRADHVKTSRKMNAKVKTLKKLILGERLHPGFNVIGTKSSRMSGSGGFNPQGIDREGDIRDCFILGPNLMGGDFNSFELTICDAVYNDPNWREMLQAGQKAHGVFGSGLYGMTYDEVMQDKQKYTQAKSGLFLLVYGGTAGGIEYKLDATAEQSKRAEKEFFNRFPKFLERREEIYRQYRPLKDNFTWQEPLEYVETLLGHRRYFTLEWNICRTLYTLAKNMPFERKNEITCERTENRLQTTSNALRSALYYTIKQIQKKASRAAINHEIQGLGADITKYVQNDISNLQPRGIHEWQIQTMNIHDELVAVVHNKELMPEVERRVYAKVDSLKEIVPLLSIEWAAGPTWKAIHG